MSYSFQVKTATKAEAKAAVEKAFDEQVIPQQAVHARDKAAALANANAMIDLLEDNDSKDINVSCYSSVGWAGGDQMAAPLTAAGTGCNAWTSPR